MPSVGLPPGVRRFERTYGRTGWLWIASQLARDTAGFMPRTKCVWIGVGEPTDIEMVAIQQECERLRQSLIRWSGDRIRRSPRGYSEGTIYFARCGDCIKIGYSGSSKLRLRDLQVGNPEPLELIGWMRGPQAVERSLHCKFDRLRVRGEWFQAKPLLLRFIAAVTQPGDPVTGTFVPPEEPIDGIECFD